VRSQVWEWARILLIGAILAPGKRAVTAALGVMGPIQERQFQNYHRVLNRAKWSSRTLSRILLRLLLLAFVPADHPVVLGLDDHIERRRGAKIAAKGIYCDAVRSSKSFFVKTSGLRWVVMMVLAPIPWAKRVTQRVPGAAVSDGPGALRALSSGTRDAAQAVDRLSAADDQAGAPLAAWYQKAVPTFSDTLAYVRQQLGPVSISWMSAAKDEVVIIPKALFERLTDTLAFAA
jgi:DDE superfamily endonuclease